MSIPDLPASTREVAFRPKYLAFDADIWVEFWSHPHSHGEPRASAMPGTDLRAWFIEEMLLGISKLVI